MLIWLASYPRSGNTYVRIVLNEVFGIPTYELYGRGDERVFAARPGVLAALGHTQGAPAGANLIHAAHASEQPYFVKTHEGPLTPDPAVFIVRDGRSAIASYRHYLNEIERIPTSLEDVIEGNVYAGSWSEHFNAWDPLNRPSTLLLRFEEITKDPVLLVTKLAEFCGITPLRAFDRPFVEFKAMFPQFFRSGDDAANIREIAPLLPLFTQRHGELMRRIAYS